MVRVIEASEATDWRTSVDRQLRTLRRLERGWDGCNSGPVSWATAAFTSAVLRSVMKPHTPAPTLVPASGGGIQLEWHEQGLDIELMIYRPVDAELTVHFLDGRPSIEEEPLSQNFELLSQVLEELI
jgi:hypothetical protein